MAAKTFSEPLPRFGHVSAPVEGKFCVWGGHTNHFFANRKELVSSLHSFDPLLETWSSDRCSGLPNNGGGIFPNNGHGIFDSACTSAGRYFYLYGGNDGSRWHSSLHRLDTKSLTWEQLSNDGPMKKVDCGMVASSNKLVLFGGMGLPSGRTQPGAEFVRSKMSHDGRGWTNELHIFNLKEGM